MRGAGVPPPRAHAPAALLLSSALLAFSAESHADSVARFPDVRADGRPPSPPLPTLPPPVPAPREPEPVPPSRASIPRTGSEELGDRAARYVEAGRITEAISAYTEAIRLDPANGAALLGLGRLRVRLGEASEAELLFSSAARLRSAASEAYAERARLRRAQGRDAEGIADLEMAVELSPDDLSRAEELSAWHVSHRAWLPALAIWRRAAADAADDRSEHRAKVQVRALGVLARDLDSVLSGSGPERSWTRRALAKVAR